MDVVTFLNEMWFGGFVVANDRFKGLEKAFWAHVRSLSQSLGYTVRGKGTIKVPILSDIMATMKKLDLTDEHLIKDGKPSPFATQLLEYFAYRAKVLNETVQHQLMDAAAAKAMYKRLSKVQKYKISETINKQSGSKKQVAYLTTMVDMFIETHAEGMNYAHNPQKLTTVTQNGMPLRTLSRRVDGAFPSTVNPVAVWENKEYYHTTTFGSRIADGVYETLLDGMELEEMASETGVQVDHILIIDAKDTWWSSGGRPYLCRMIDMLHMGYVDEILFGKEIEDRLPTMVTEWVRKTKARQAAAKAVLTDDTPIL